jgi:D-proline reductase (dithiol) PrdB
MCHRSVGLVQNSIEAAGIATVSLSMVPYVTYGVRVPRALYLRFPYGNPFGEPSQIETQTTILYAALRWLHDAERPNQPVRLDVKWRRSRFNRRKRS